MDRRHLALAVSVAAGVACATPRTAVYPSFAERLVVVGDAVLPAVTGRGTPRPDAGGLSGAYFEAETNRLYAVSDDRQRPRVVGFDLTVAPAVTLTRSEVVPLEPPTQQRTLDAEGIAPAPGNHWFVSSEGDPTLGFQPVAGIHEYSRDGRFVRSLPLPPAYFGAEGDDSSGMRLNLSLEALSTSPDRNWLFAAMESSLLQDGPMGDFTRGAIVRILAYDLRDRAAAPREYAYVTDAMRRPTTWAAADGDAGVVDVLALSPRDLLVLERGYIVEAEAPAPRRENTIRIYRVTLDRAAEITGRASLTREPPASVLRKRLVLDLATVSGQLRERLRGLENFEAMTFGPRLPDGSATVLLLSDDNFSPGQVTALVALRWAK